MKKFLAIAALTSTLIAAPAFAGTFATFSQQNTPPKSITWDNLGGSSATMTGSGLYDFKFLPSAFGGALDPALTVFQDANFSLSATASTPAGQSGNVIEQLVDSGTISFTRVTPLNGLTNLLTITFTNAYLWGPISTTGLNLVSDTTIGTVNFSSDFVNFGNSNPLDYGFNFSLQGVSPLVNYGPQQLLRDFTADASGLAAVPEPATWAMMIIGFAGLGSALRSNRRRLATAA